MMNSSADDDETLGWSEKAEDAFLEEYNVADKVISSMPTWMFRPLVANLLENLISYMISALVVSSIYNFVEQQQKIQKWEPDDVSERSFITREDISVRSFMTGSLVTGSLLTGDEDVEKQPGKPSSDHTEGTQDEAAESDDDFPVHNVIQKKIRSINKLASCCVCWVLLLVLTAEVMVALVLFRLWRNPRDTTMESPSSSSYGDLPPYPSPILPTQTTRSPTSVLSTPTPSMVVVPTTEAFRTRRQKLIRLSPSSEEALFLSSSAQYRALEWLTFESNYTSYSSSEDRVVQRWVMATIFYSLRGRRWTRSDNWLGEMHECDWFSVDPTKYCDENGNVVGIYLSNNRLGGLIPDEISLLSNHLGRSSCRILLLLIDKVLDNVCVVWLEPNQPFVFSFCPDQQTSYSSFIPERKCEHYWDDLYTFRKALQAL